MPLLSESFGKNISKNLAVLSERSRELDEYLSHRADVLMNRAVYGPFGWWVDGRGIHRVELRYLLQKIAKRENMEFFTSTGEAVRAGYRPCKRCQPELANGQPPAWVAKRTYKL